MPLVSTTQDKMPKTSKGEGVTDLTAVTVRVTADSINEVRLRKLSKLTVEPMSTNASSILIPLTVQVIKV